MLTREQIALRAARELHEGETVYLDAGLTDLIANHLPAGARLTAEPCRPPIDVALVIASQVATNGEFASSSPGPQAARTIVLLERHHADDGSPHVLATCPRPAGRATRVITDLAVFDVTPDGLVMREVAPGVSALDVQLKSGAPLLAADDLKVIRV